jgi:hypothetical protein
MSALSRLDVLRAHLSAGGACSGESGSIGSERTAAAPRFKYTVDAPAGVAPILTLAQREFYEENGYIVFPRLVPAADLEAYRDRFNALCDGTVMKSPMMTLMRDGAWCWGWRRAAAMLNRV